VFYTPGATIDGLTSFGATYDALPAIPFDSPSWNASSSALAYFDTSHAMKTLSATSTGGVLTTGDFGDDARVSMLRSSRLRLTSAPTSATAQVFCKMAAGDAVASNGSATALNDGKFDHRQSARWHRIAYTLTGPFEATGFDPELLPEGQR
jgi:hypothetical protein